MNVSSGTLVVLIISSWLFNTMANTIRVEDRLQRDFSDMEIIKVVKITGNLISAGNGQKLEDFLRNLRKVVYKRRLAKCVKVFGSESICQNKANFYIWAQQMAKEIMSGEMA